MRRHLEACRLCLNGVRIIDENHGVGGQCFLHHTKENQYFILPYMFDPSGMIFFFCLFHCQGPSRSQVNVLLGQASQ